MARYLTPGKLSTLILTEIHLLSDEPFSPGLLDVLSSHVLPTHYASSSIDGLASDLSKSSDVQSLCVSLQALPSSLPGRTAFDFFLSQAWACVDLDSLHGLFDRLHRLAHPEQVEDRRISPASPLGSFLRRCLVEWTRLQFADSLALLEVFRLWLEPTRERWSRIDPEGATHLAAKEVCHKASSAAFASQELSISSEDVEVALTHSISVLQRIGQRMPSDLKHKISSWSRQLSSQSLAHFMAFYESWRAGEYTMALENLHRYFDYSLSASRAVEDAAGPRVQYQYALLHLSVLHADFERWQESVESMEECVITGTVFSWEHCCGYRPVLTEYNSKREPGHTLSAFRPSLPSAPAANPSQYIASIVVRSDRACRQWRWPGRARLPQAQSSRRKTPLSSRHHPARGSTT